MRLLFFLNHFRNFWIDPYKISEDLISCTLHFGFNYEINYQLDAIEYLFALSSFGSTYFGLTRPSSGAISVTISYKCSIWCPWFLPGKVSVLRSVCAVGVLHCSATAASCLIIKIILGCTVSKTSKLASVNVIQGNFNATGSYQRLSEIF